MHDIEPHHLWRDRYVAAEDKRSPHYGRIYDEFRFTKLVYNYYIHPQWDEFGSTTLYAKIIYADYEEGVAIIELIGEWNDCLTNDVSALKQNLIDPLINEGIHKYILVMDHVLSFHGSDDCYYEEWFEDIIDENGYFFFINLLDHVRQEMLDTGIHHFTPIDHELEVLNWRSFQPKALILQVESIAAGLTKLIQ